MVDVSINDRREVADGEQSKQRGSFVFWKKKDHSQSIEKIALQLASTEGNTGALPWLSIKEAARYASDKSPLFGNNNNWFQCHTVIGKGYYNLEFKTRPEGGVYLSSFYYHDV